VDNCRAVQDWSSKSAIQIFAYLLLFEPKVILIDEPDAHLHPDKQERLFEALSTSSGITTACRVSPDTC
jgi:predicted ATP-dependent endonuclease of OLD family